MVNSSSADWRDGEVCLVVLSGLPGVGKTTLAREVAARSEAVHLRIDTIEAALNASGLVAAAGGWESAPDAGYRVAYGLARDLLRTGHSVIADSVNPMAITRRAWADVAVDTSARLIQVEVICEELRQHRMRVQKRRSDLDGLIVPTWEDVQERHYEPWSSAVLRVDTSRGISDAVQTLVDSLTASAGQ